MARKRSPANDYICIRCGCPAEADGSRHLGGGQGMKACSSAPHVQLRSEYEAEIAEWVGALKR